MFSVSQLLGEYPPVPGSEGTLFGGNSSYGDLLPQRSALTLPQARPSSARHWLGQAVEREAGESGGGPGARWRGGWVAHLAATQGMHWPSMSGWMGTKLVATKGRQHLRLRSWPGHAAERDTEERCVLGEEEVVQLGKLVGQGQAGVPCVLCHQRCSEQPPASAHARSNYEPAGFSKESVKRVRTCQSRFPATAHEQLCGSSFPCL